MAATPAPPLRGSRRRRRPWQVGGRRRPGRRGDAHVHKRFALWREGEFGRLLEWWREERAEAADRLGPPEATQGRERDGEAQRLQSRDVYQCAHGAAAGVAEREPRAVVEHLGTDVALDLLEQTERVQAEGGMIVPDTGKPRTSGGIFFKLLKDASDLPRAEQEADVLRIDYTTEANLDGYMGPSQTSSGSFLVRR